MNNYYQLAILDLGDFQHLCLVSAHLLEAISLHHMVQPSDLLLAISALYKHAQAGEVFRHDLDCICWLCVWHVTVPPYRVEAVNLLVHCFFPGLSPGRQD